MRQEKSGIGFFTGWQVPRVNESICAGDRCYTDAVKGKALCAVCIKRRAATRLISRPGYSWIYLAASQGKVRIGHATNLNLSLGSMRDSCPSAVDLLVAFEGPKDLAALTREKFEDHRDKGRWFQMGEDIEVFASLIKKGLVRELYPSATGRVLGAGDIVDTA